MARRKHNPKKYKRTQPGDPLTDKWTIRNLKRNGEKRDVLIRKRDKKREIRVIYDERMTPIISFSKAKKINKARRKSARTKDSRQNHRNVKKFADKAWEKNPGRSDVKGIDTKKK